MSDVRVLFLDVNLALREFPPNVLAAIEIYMRGYISMEPTQATPPHGVITYRSPSADLGKRGLVARFYEAGSETIFAELAATESSNNFCLRPTDGSTKATQMLVRVVRALLSGYLLNAGWQFLHSAAVGIGDNCVGIVGQKRQGKTTLLLNCLEYSSLSPMTNDKLAVQFHRNRPKAGGFPIRAGVRIGTLTKFPYLERRLSCLEADNSGGDKHVRVGISELAQLFNRSVIPFAEIKAFIVPARSSRLDGPQLVRLSPECASKVLEENYLRSFEEVEPLQHEISMFLPSYRVSPLVASDMPVFKLFYSPETVVSAVQVIERLLMADYA